MNPEGKTRARGPAPETPALIVVGASTGGPSALNLFLRGLPEPCDVPILIAQHILPAFSVRLAQYLTVLTGRQVVEAVDGQIPAPGCIYLAPPERQMSVVGSVFSIKLRVADDPPERSCRPSVDVLFRSAARVCGRRTLAVILTGMGNDGLDGCRHVHSAGGEILAQDEDSSVIWGMPGAVVISGLTETILPPGQLGKEVARRLGESAEKDPGSECAPGSGRRPSVERGHELVYLRNFLKDQAGLNLGEEFKPIVLARLRELARSEGYPGLSALLAALRFTSFGGLHQRLIEASTIHETSFFRDGHPFVSFRDIILTSILNSPRAESTVRIWSAGCSTGQEPYSIAMILADHAVLKEPGASTVLASDLCPRLVNAARLGEYSRFEVGRGLAPEPRARFFMKEDSIFRVRDELRSRVTFSEINLQKPWPPLPGMDAVFLRNILIYLSDPVRNEIVENLARVIRPGGWLTLGATESPPQDLLTPHFEQKRIGPSTWYRRRNC